MAEYCAWRSRRFWVSDVDVSDLQCMTLVNFEREFGMPLDELPLPVERPTVCDSYMQLHAWVQTDDDRWLKRDGALHGDDHFFPGPCDIAWDLAGITVERELDSAGREFLLAEYRRASGDDATPRLGSYELAYAVFRLAWRKMAAASVCDAVEQQRLLRDYRRYRRAAEARSRSFAAAYLL